MPPVKPLVRSRCRGHQLKVRALADAPTTATERGLKSRRTSCSAPVTSSMGFHLAMAIHGFPSQSVVGDQDALQVGRALARLPQLRVVEIDRDRQLVGEGVAAEDLGRRLRGTIAD